MVCKLDRCETQNPYCLSISFVWALRGSKYFINGWPIGFSGGKIQFNAFIRISWVLQIACNCSRNDAACKTVARLLWAMYLAMLCATQRQMMAQLGACEGMSGYPIWRIISTVPLPREMTVATQPTMRLCGLPRVLSLAKHLRSLICWNLWLLHLPITASAAAYRTYYHIRLWSMSHTILISIILLIMGKLINDSCMQLSANRNAIFALMMSNVHGTYTHNTYMYKTRNCFITMFNIFEQSIQNGHVHVTGYN